MDTVPTEKRSEIMSRVRRENSAPEVTVRRLLHAMGYRFRLHRKDLPGKPDVVLPRFRTVVFVHGCFWHGCAKCERGMRPPKSNPDFWSNKRAYNQRLHEAAKEALTASGWRVIVVQECELKDLNRLRVTLSDQLPKT